MTRLVISRTGRITLTPALLAHLGALPGATLTVEYASNGRIELRIAPKNDDISAFYGLLEQPGRKAMTIEEMNEAIETHWRDDEEEK